MPRSVVVALLIVPLLVACRSSDLVIVDEGPLQEDAFVARYAKSVCGALAPCCVELGIAGSQKKCREVVELRDAPAGATTYRESLARECLRQLEASPPTCNWPWAPEVCEKVFRGSKEVLEPCNAWPQCAPAEAPGEDVSCSFYFANAVCQRFRYVADVGEPCNQHRNPDGSPAEVVTTCKRGLSCWIDDKCHEPSEEGGVCPCANHFGYDLSCGDANTCVRADHIHPHWLAVCQ